MATENNNNQEPVQNEVEKGVEEEPENQWERRAERPKEFWPGRVQNGVLYCDCEGDYKPMCFTVKDPKKHTRGQKFWKCRRENREKCSFFIWDTDVPAAKAWLAIHGPPPPEPQTPKGKEKEAAGSNGKSGQNPWTFAAKSSKRKAASISREVSDEDENGGPSGLNGNGNVDTPDTESDEVIGDPSSPSRKAAKRSRQDTPGKVLERVQKVADGLPTPDTGKQLEQVAVASGSRNTKEIAEASVRLGEVIDLTADVTSDLTIAVLDELKSARVELKASTVAYIGHLINTEMELNDTRMRRCQMTISSLKKELDKMESALLAMTGMTDDDAVELSD